MILTRNLKDFPAEPLASWGVVVREPDEYLIEMFDQYPDEMVGIVGEMASDRSNPPMTTIEIADALGRAGAPRVRSSTSESHRRRSLSEPAAQRAGGTVTRDHHLLSGVTEGVRHLLAPPGATRNP